MDVVSYVLGYQGGLKKGSGQGVELPELTTPAGAAQIREGYEAIGPDGAKIEGEMPTVDMYIDRLSIDKTNGKIVAGARVSGDGYIQQKSETETYTLDTLGATTIEPGAEDQVIDKHRWLTGDITVKGVALQEKTVTPGEVAIEITPDEGFLGLAKVLVDAVAAGGGGSSGSWVSANGYFDATTSSHVVTHNMGVKPDIVVVYANKTPSTNKAIYLAAGVSSALIDKGITLSDISKVAVYSKNGGSVMSMGVGVTMDSGNSQLVTYGFPRELTTTTFKVGGGTSMGYTDTNVSYYWFAIGGIT